MTKRPKYIAELSAEQEKLIEFLLDEVGEVFDHSIENLSLIQQHMGWNPRTMRLELSNLSAKGWLRTVPQRKTTPRRWMILRPDLRHPDAHVIGHARCWNCGQQHRYTLGDCNICGAQRAPPFIPLAHRSA